MAGEIEAYQDALVALSEQEKRVESMFGIISSIARVSFNSEWQKVDSSQSRIQTGRSGVDSRTIDGSQWPTWKQLIDGIAEWRNLAIQAKGTYEAIPTERRTGLSRPHFRYGLQKEVKQAATSILETE